MFQNLMLLLLSSAGNATINGHLRMSYYQSVTEYGSHVTVQTYSHDFRLPPWCKRDLCSSEILHNVNW